ncbi:capsular biosynthesis protein [uncultured Clostridium sp.]|uniref:lipopolysaccharide biosynthesis protein n=1 Tax=uncultured Clostridium sp. TaxID=59620 RepID=UPI002608891D|nr:capsular biosynthesis protein [uncultured Clostridium sp.]
MNIKGSIARVFSANLLTMVSGILIGFIVPAVLSLDSYAYVKTYMLYVGYIGFLHFGFIDGMYIKYGGKSIDEIDKSVLKAEHNIFIIMQTIMTLIIVTIAIITKDFILILFGISILPINTGSFHKLFYQSTGQFKSFAKTSYIYSIIYLTINMIGAYVLKSDNYIFYCLASLIGHIVVFSILEIKICKEFRGIKATYTKDLKNNIKVGAVILIANLGVMIFSAADLWFVKIGLSKESFAYYSFAISMLNIINVMIMSVSITFYNFLAKEENEELVLKLKNYFILFGGLCSFAYFGFAMIVNIFIKKYTPALEIIAISFAGFPYIIVIKGLLVNLYNARKDEKKYLKVMLSMVAISIVYNLIAIIIFKTMESIAMATLLSFITWYIYSSYDLGYTKVRKKEILYLAIVLVAFLITTNTMHWIVGAVMYLIIYTLVSFCMYNKEINEAIGFISSKLKAIRV